MLFLRYASVVLCFKTHHFQQNDVCLVFSAIFVSLWLKILFPSPRVFSFFLSVLSVCSCENFCVNSSPLVVALPCRASVLKIIRPEMIRRRKYLVGALFATVAVGLASRKWPGLLPAGLGKYPGDALWAGMVYWAVAFVAPSAPLIRVAAYAMAISYLDELSQLYQAAWINQIRATTIGHLLLGSAFSWLDLLAYTVGVWLCSAIEVILLKVFRDRPKELTN